MTKEQVFELLTNMRKNWGLEGYDFERGIRVLAGALLRYSGKDEFVLDTIYAAIDEAERRQLYQIMKGIRQVDN